MYSKDLINWSEAAEYDSPPENFKSYSCSFSDSYSEAIICYNCDDKVILREYHLRDKSWTNETVVHKEFLEYKRKSDDDTADISERANFFR